MDAKIIICADIVNTFNFMLRTLQINIFDSRAYPGWPPSQFHRELIQDDRTTEKTLTGKNSSSFLTWPCLLVSKKN